MKWRLECIAQRVQISLSIVVWSGARRQPRVSTCRCVGLVGLNKQSIASGAPQRHRRRAAVGGTTAEARRPSEARHGPRPPRSLPARPARASSVPLHHTNKTFRANFKYTPKCNKPCKRLCKVCPVDDPRSSATSTVQWLQCSIN